MAHLEKEQAFAQNALRARGGCKSKISIADTAGRSWIGAMKMEWISVEDRLPKCEEKVLVWYESFGHDIGWYCNGAWQFLCDNLSKNVKIIA